MQCVRWNRLAIAIIVIVYGKTHEIMGEFSFSVVLFSLFLVFFSVVTVRSGSRKKNFSSVYRIVRCYFSIVLNTKFVLAFFSLSLSVCIFSLPSTPLSFFFVSVFMDQCFFSFVEWNVQNEKEF